MEMIEISCFSFFFTVCSFICFTMPPKGDSVEEGEILLSTTLSELLILENHDDMCVYEGKPARKYTVSSFVFI